MDFDAKGSGAKIPRRYGCGGSFRPRSHASDEEVAVAALEQFLAFVLCSSLSIVCSARERGSVRAGGACRAGAVRLEGASFHVDTNVQWCALMVMQSQVLLTIVLLVQVLLDRRVLTPPPPWPVSVLRSGFFFSGSKGAHQPLLEWWACRITVVAAGIEPGVVRAFYQPGQDLGPHLRSHDPACWRLSISCLSPSISTEIL